MTLKSFEIADSTEARQFLLDRRDERNHPKRHRTQKRAKAVSAGKRAKAKHKRAANDRARRKKLIAAQRYWRGQGDHP